MTVLFETQELIFELLNHDSLDECIALMTNAFSVREPLTRIQGITEGDFAMLARSFCLKGIEEEFAITARDRESGRLVGALVSEDLCTHPPQDSEAFSPKFAAIQAVLDDLNHWFEDQKPQRGDYVHMFLIGVDVDYHNRSVATQLVSFKKELARSRGYKGIVAKCTTERSARTTARNGFFEAFSVPYQTFEHHGKRVFETLKDSSCRLMVSQLT